MGRVLVDEVEGAVGPLGHDVGRRHLAYRPHGGEEVWSIPRLLGPPELPVREGEGPVT